MAQAVERKLTGNGERNNNQEQVSESTYDELRKIMQVLTPSREEAHNGLVAIGRKLNVSKYNIKTAVLTTENPLIQNH